MTGTKTNDWQHFVEPCGTSLAGDELFAVHRVRDRGDGVLTEDVAPHRWVRYRYAVRACTTYHQLPASLFGALPSNLVIDCYRDLFGGEMCDPDPVEPTAEDQARALNARGQLAPFDLVVHGG